MQRKAWVSHNSLASPLIPSAGRGGPVAQRDIHDGPRQQAVHSALFAILLVDGKAWRAESPKALTLELDLSKGLPCHVGLMIETLCV